MSPGRLDDNMAKIPIKSVSEKLFNTPGFDERGCFGTDCEDLCCNGSCEVDKAAHDLMLEHRGKIEALTGVPLESCIDGDFVADPDYPGGAYAESARREDGYCRFHNPEGKGCVLYMLSFRQGLPKGIVPAICRLFPVTWHEGRLFHYDEDGSVDEEDLTPKKCNICRKAPASCSHLFATQRDDIHEIFEVDSGALEGRPASAKQSPP